MAAVSPAVNDAGLSLPEGTILFREHEDGDGYFGVLTNDLGTAVVMRLPADAQIPEAVVAMADIVQEVVRPMLDEPGGSRHWPPCPDHPSEHSLQAAVEDREPTWLCPMSGERVARIGGLVGDEEAALFLRAQHAAKVAWFDRYAGLGLEEARRLAEEEGRPIRIFESSRRLRPSLVYDRLNLFLGPDGELVGMRPG